MEDNQNPRPIGFTLDIVVFVCGAIVMIYEIVGSRILAPFIGTSTYVWTSLIGVILAALSLGYWIGGKMADRRPDVGILAVAILFASGLVSLTTVIKEIVLSAIASVSVLIEIKAVIAALILFAPASITLGFITPFAVKLRMASLGEAGKTVGRLYAVSTVGSIVGTFAAGFFLLPFVGSVRTLYIIAASLFVLSVALVPFAFSRRNISILALLLLGITASELWRYGMFRINELTDIDTEYSRVQVFRAEDSQTGWPIRALSFDPYSTQSAMFLDSDDLVFEYTKFYHLIRVLKSDFQRSLLIGGAGYSFPKAYLASYPDAVMDVVEIDPAMTEIARQQFRLKHDPRLRIFHEDGRVFLNQASSAQYDVVLMDAFGTLFSVPFQLTTREAVQNINRVLKDDGVVIFNLGSSIRGPASKFLQSEFATYQEIFPNVYLFKVRPERSDLELQNLIVVACKLECLPIDSNGNQSIDSVLARRYNGAFPLELPALTDDLAPVERYNSIAQANSR